MKRKLETIYNFFGKENQKEKLLEELDELTQAIYNYLQIPSKQRFIDILHELVDVTMLTVQIGISEGLTALGFWLLFINQYKYKIKRTIKIIKQCKSGEDYDGIRDRQRKNE